RHIPVTVVSKTDVRQDVMKAGAFGYIEKPVEDKALGQAISGIEEFIDRRVRNLLVVEDDDAERNSIVQLIGGGDDVDITAVGSGEEALAALADKPFDCAVLDLKLPD